jgi:hypothetical protein
MPDVEGLAYNRLYVVAGPRRKQQILAAAVLSAASKRAGKAAQKCVMYIRGIGEENRANVPHTEPPTG